MDGQAIDPWHLAAVLEGLRLRMDHAGRIIDRGMILDAARHALDLHGWLTSPDFGQEGDIQRAEAALVTFSRVAPLLAAAVGAHAWLDGGGERPPLRAALIRHWRRHRLLRDPVPLTGAAALRPDTPWNTDVWVPEFLTALAEEAQDGLQLLAEMERIWFAAGRAVAGGRSDSRAGPAVDLMAATPLVSATSLASGLGMAVKNATALLDRFLQGGHRDRGDASLEAAALRFGRPCAAARRGGGAAAARAGARQGTPAAASSRATSAAACTARSRAAADPTRAARPRLQRSGERDGVRG